ncbi:hypothetical protein CP967_07045 [Streptomyces nitrosporeus]|uniref:Uncharacterized protein n=1 Tax=Streptomyces nitrosporeus TaxID=28894 RepID=A0A5J6F606_9ACTN|nr:hypothetical protein CP967_07045 [Streptomyces nitrosporeus]GGY94596.1 hypothetical protein GCM10010327_26570 [Streptomyces nitrosporeus]
MEGADGARQLRRSTQTTRPYLYYMYDMGEIVVRHFGCTAFASVPAAAGPAARPPKDAPVPPDTAVA